MQTLIQLINAIIGIFRAIPQSLILLLVRFAVFFSTAFYASGMKKFDGFLHLAEFTPFLFEEEFKLHIFGSVYDMPFPTVTAFLAGLGEVALSIAILIGLATRFSALGLIAMTCVMQLVFPDAWKLHMGWATYFFVLLSFGPGKISLDALVERNFKHFIFARII